jgi:hypothetical protein
MLYHQPGLSIKGAAAGKSRPPQELDARRAWFSAMVSDWVKARNLDQAMTREEIGALSGFNRMLAQRHSLVDNLGHLYATNGRLDVAPGVLLLITYLADNGKGCCTLSIERMADFFSRTERRVSEAIGRLERAQVIFVDPPGSLAADGTWSRTERNGRNKPSTYWPVINRDFVSRDPLTWFVDARAPRDANNPVVNGGVATPTVTTGCSGPPVVDDAATPTSMTVHPDVHDSAPRRSRPSTPSSTSGDTTLDAAIDTALSHTTRQRLLPRAREKQEPSNGTAGFGQKLLRQLDQTLAALQETRT